jgi:hypothetical protein
MFPLRSGVEAVACDRNRLNRKAEVEKPRRGRVGFEHRHRRFDALMRKSSPTVGSSGSETAAGDSFVSCCKSSHYSSNRLAWDLLYSGSTLGIAPWMGLATL